MIEAIKINGQGMKPTASRLVRLARLRSANMAIPAMARDAAHPAQMTFAFTLIPPYLWRHHHVNEDYPMRKSFVFAASLLAIGVAVPAVIAPIFAKPATSAPAKAMSLQSAIAGAHRSEANRARDKYRNPQATLTFFGIKPNHTVVEIWPGAGWYTEILAPYLSAKGKLIVAAPLGRGFDGISKRLDAAPELYGKTARSHFPTALGGTGVAPGSADLVVTFRNVHNWRIGSGHPESADYSAAAFKELFAMLKPGGVLGIEDHRLNENQDAALERESGYMKTSSVRKLAEEAGFKFAGSSEVNANPKDTKDYPKGVWTLPPRLAEGETDKARYQAIGESDRMTLKFIKPKR
jgi:predicted methyltransferase